MPIKKALLILLLIAVVGFVFVFTVYYYKTVLSVDLYQNNSSIGEEKKPINTGNIKEEKTSKENNDIVNNSNIIELSQEEIADKDQADKLLKALETSQQDGDKKTEENIEVKKAESEARLKLLDYLDKQ